VAGAVRDAGRLVGDGPHEQIVGSVPECASLWPDYARSLGAVALQHVATNEPGNALERRWRSETFEKVPPGTSLP
jgi:hypothetical protein